MLPGPRAYAWAALYAAALLTIHLIVTKATGSIPPQVKASIGSDAGSTLTRPWALLSSQFFHNTWGHIGYNLTVLMATLPFAVQGHGPKVLAGIVLASALGALFVNVLLVLPLSGLWAPAAGVIDGRLVGASIAIFAGAGMALTTADWSIGLKAGVIAGYVIYELVLTLAGVTGPFVALYHVAGAAAGIGLGVLFGR